MALSLLRYADSNSCLTSLLKERSRKARENSISIEIDKFHHLPENLIIEILARLPVKDLLQYKSVSKSWYAIISSPNFITKHLKDYYNNNNDWRNCLLVQHYVTHAELQLYELFVDETPRVLAHEVLYDIPSYSSYICGPCDGLYYVYQYDSSDRSVWNPAINQFKQLPNIVCKPDLPTVFTYAKGEVYGFGSDPITGDYKVVVIKGYYPITDDDDDVEHPPSILVYSLRTNSWKYCGDLSKPYDLESNKCYIYANGCCYWIGSHDENSSEVIISFDFATDECKEIDVPDYTQPSSKCLGVYDDSLALLCVQESQVFDIWTWENEEGCWSKKSSVGPFDDVRAPIGHWKGNMVILQCEDGRLVLFDGKTSEVKDLGFQNESWCEGVFAYMESLVPIEDREVGEGVLDSM